VSADDRDLIARTLAHDDRAAFGELVRRHQSAVRNFLRHLSGDAALADDLAQDTFVFAYRELARFRGDAAFSTWLLGIAHNHWRNARRKQRTVPLGDDHLASLEAEPAATARSEWRTDLAGALRALSDEERSALHACYTQGLSHREAAAVLDWPLGTVKTHVNRAKEKLRRALASWNPNT
jgi:RNA polymerase sigma factor (sigma-70 family)